MSINVQADFVTVFDREVKHQYQEIMSIPMDATELRAVAGKTLQAPLVGLADTTLHIPGSPGNPVNRPSTPITLVMTDVESQAWIDVFQNKKIPYDDRQVAAKQIGNALGRQMDQFRIDAGVATTSTKSVPTTVSGAAADLTVAAFQEAGFLLDVDGVPSEGRIAWVHPSGIKNLLTSDKTTSSDFMMVKALVRGEIDTFYGFKIIKIGNRTVQGLTGGLPITGGDIRTNIFYHKDAIITGQNMGFNITLSWENRESSHLAVGRLSANAIEYDPLGIVTVLTDESP